MRGRIKTLAFVSIFRNASYSCRAVVIEDENMNKAIVLVLLIAPDVFSFPQYSEDAYRRQYEEQEAQQYNDESQFQKRIPQIPPRTARPFARIHKVPQPLIPTAAPQQERYTRPQPQLPIVLREGKYKPIPLPLLSTVPQQERYPQPQLPAAPQEETYNSDQIQSLIIPTQDERYRPQPQYPTPPTQEEKYNRPQPASQNTAPQGESKPLYHVQSLFSSQDDKYNRPGDEKYSTPIPILKFEKSASLDGSYKSSYETGNNIIHEESGFIKNIGIKDQEALVQQGSYSYTAPDGTVINRSYIADEHGFRVEGPHIPTPPPLPEEIRKSLETIYEGIKQQQEAEAKEAKYGKSRPGSVEETNLISDNYPNYS